MTPVKYAVLSEDCLHIKEIAEILFNTFTYYRSECNFNTIEKIITNIKKDCGNHNVIAPVYLIALNSLDNSLVGFISWNQDEIPEAIGKNWISDLYVKPMYRCRGVAKDLINRMLRIIYNRSNSREVFLLALDHMVMYYKNLNFNRVGKYIYPKTKEVYNIMKKI